MKVKLTLKDPDGVYEGLRDAGVDPNDPPAEVERVMRQYVEFSEYVTVEVDTNTGQARVVPLT